MKRILASFWIVLVATAAWAANPEWTLTPADVEGAPSARDWLPPYDHPAIDYEHRATDDPVARLDRDLGSGRAKLAFDLRSGYLRAVLDALKVPADSQLLLFARSSLQRPYISPTTPRAVYFTPDVAVAFIKGAPLLEVAIQDPVQGRVFYTLDQTDTPAPRFTRQLDCLGCHLSRSTMGVPGSLDRSVSATVTGRVISRRGSRTPDHRTAIAERWGGWYVTGAGALPHAGNTALPEDDIEAAP
ncbi:MAG: hypothetical protein ACYCZX_06180, partial [Rhodospirillaceae bacterium]